MHPVAPNPRRPPGGQQPPGILRRDEPQRRRIAGPAFERGAAAETAMGTLHVVGLHPGGEPDDELGQRDRRAGRLQPPALIARAIRVAGQCGNEGLGDRAVQSLHLAFLMWRVGRGGIDLDTECERGVLDRARGELQPVIPAQPSGHPAERPPLGVHEQRVAQRGQHLGRAGPQRDRPAHDRPREVIQEQRHPRPATTSVAGRDDEQRELLVIGLPDRVAMRRLIAQIQAMLAPPGLPAPRGRALGGRQLTRKRRLQRPQRRRRTTLVSPPPPDGRGVTAQPQVRVALLVAEHKPRRVGTTAHQRPAGRHPAPERPLTHPDSGRRLAHLAAGELSPASAGDQVGHQPAHGLLAQLATTLTLLSWLPARPSHR
jgi:hypothetical protein